MPQFFETNKAAKNFGIASGVVSFIGFVPNVLRLCGCGTDSDGSLSVTQGGWNMASTVFNINGQDLRALLRVADQVIMADDDDDNTDDDAQG